MRLIKSAIKIRTLFLSSLVLSFILVISCKQDPVKDYGEGLIGAYESSQRAVEQVNLVNMQRAVRMYRIANGKLPDMLEDVSYMMDSQVDFDKYQYDPETGKVKLKSK